MSTAENEAPSQRWRRWWSPQAVLLVTFTAFYFAIGPGNFFSVNETAVEETAQALILRRTLDIPALIDSPIGRGSVFYSQAAPGLALTALPFVYVGLKLDDAMGSMNGGVLAGPPMGSEEQPLRWSGRLVISATLMLNALVGGAIVALLFMVGVRLSGDARAALLMAVAAGVATLVMSEATHLYQHALDALMLLVAFWFFGGRSIETLDRRALYGGLALGVAILTRPNAEPGAAVLGIYGAAVAWSLIRNFPDRYRRALRWSALSAVGPVASVAGYLYYNYLRLGNFFHFAYNRPDDHMVVDPAMTLKSIAAYLVTPSLSVFVYAPPLLLAIAMSRRAYRRWPLETGALLAASAAHLVFISLWPGWHGDLSYGPRYMLELIVLLMPLTMPAFEMAATRASRPIAIAMAAAVSLGFVVQLVGVAVFVVVNEWVRTAAQIAKYGAWVFVPRVSPIVVGLEQMWAGRNLSPWALRAFAQPGPALVLFLVLFVIVCEGCLRIFEYFRTPEQDLARISSDRLPVAIVLAATLSIIAGFAIVQPVTDARDIREYQLVEAGLAAQQTGRAVAAAEDYAIVLGLDSNNKFARYDLGILQEGAGRPLEALALYESALNADPSFTPAQLRVARILQARAAR